MATGTGNLPHDGMSFSPFAILTAEEMNDLVENIESLADGTGIGDDAVTPAKRSGGFFIGSIPAATFGTTGNKSITGIGFRPRLVRFTLAPTASTVATASTNGAMDENGNQFYVSNASSGASASYGRNSSTAACIAIVGAGSATPNMVAVYVSMDADGFTINVTTANNLWPVSYEAYA